MKLKSLRIHGFKSFADRTTLDFREGVTAIVGSNGCGKSNIADSIRWVLGEQRASALRGSKMEEVIFQGTSKRRPLNFAEVSLLFENDRGRVAIPQSEIEVSRKVFREGGSEYALNRNECRLRDIHDLLRDTGLGSNAYAIIEAGMIETLLSDRAEERRLLFEEAAGIGRYKDSRQAAMRRLEAAEADLARLQDLLAEVDSKVRALSRQRKRAERHQELQARKMELDVAIAREEVATLTDATHEAEGRRAELEREHVSAAAERSTAETLLEERRVAAAEVAQRRAEVAARLDEVRRSLEAREREVLVADERRSHAELRIEQLVRERGELQERRASLAAEIERARLETARLAGVLEGLRERVEARSEQNRAQRDALAAERLRTEEAASRSRDLAREIATTEGERAVAERRRRDAEERAAELTEEERRLEAELKEATAQTDLWSGRAAELREQLAAASEAAEGAREEDRLLRVREQAAREALRAADDRLSRLAAQVDAREALERGYEGFAPAVAAVMSDRLRFRGVRGPLADFVGEADGAAVEAYLGPLLQALVVDDLGAARALRDWFRGEWEGGGSLLLLPLDALQRRRDRGGEAWAEALLTELQVVTGDPLAEHELGVARVGPAGEVVDARGIVRLGERGARAGEGILSRRAELGRMRAERDTAAAEREARAVGLEGIREALAVAEERAQEAEEIRRVLEGEVRRAELDGAAHQHRSGRLAQDRATLAQSLRALREGSARAAEQLATLQKRRLALMEALEAAGAKEAAGRARLLELEQRWEQARDEESELRVEVARAEAELREAERRLRSGEHQDTFAATRLETVEREALELRGTLEGLSGVRERAGADIQGLFQTRDREAGRLAVLESRVSELEVELAGLGERARLGRRQEAETSVERHRVDLQLAEMRGRAERARDRLEAEWGRPWEVLLRAAEPLHTGTPESWRAEQREVARQLEGLGPVNLLAVEEHAEEDRRLRFLTEQRDDLVRAREDLISAIRQINKTARDVFMETFGAVRGNFQRVFQSLFQGGECDLWLADPDDPLESPIEIQASPVGKRTQRIHLLSGGERTLTALALLFALYLVKPSPFCVLDEVDAPLDESNVGRFVQLLNDFKEETQFVVITHNPRTMESADWVYGVTMEEPGVSSIVGVELLGAWSTEDRVA